MGNRFKHTLECLKRLTIQSTKKLRTESVTSDRVSRTGFLAIRNKNESPSTLKAFLATLLWSTYSRSFNFFQKSLQNVFKMNPSKVLAFLGPTSCVLINSGRYKTLPVKKLVVTWATSEAFSTVIMQCKFQGYDEDTKNMLKFF